MANKSEAIWIGLSEQRSILKKNLVSGRKLIPILTYWERLIKFLSILSVNSQKLTEYLLYQNLKKSIPQLNVSPVSVRNLDFYSKV